MREQSLLDEARGGALALPTDLKWAEVADIERANIFNYDAMMYLRGLSEFVYHRQDVGHHIMHFIQQEAPRDPDEFSCVNKDQLKKDLSFLIFTDDFAEKAVECITDSSVYSRNALYWATDFLGNLMNRSYRYVQVPKCDLSTLRASCFEPDFSDNWVPSDVIGEYKYGNTDAQRVNVWFSHSYPIGGGVQSTDKRSIDINIMKIDGKRELTFINELDSEGYHYYFHGTNWNGVESIMKDGIKSNISKTCDFSNKHNLGFYTLSSFKAARELAEGSSQPAVVVFKIGREYMTGDRHLNYTTEDKKTLHQIFQYFRAGGNIEETLKGQLEQCATITGPPLRHHSQGNDYQHMMIEMKVKETCFHIDKRMNDNVGGDIPSFLMSSIHGVLYYPERSLRKAQRATKQAVANGKVLPV